MEDINNKAFDDELNKGEETIEGKRRDRTPLPKRRNNKVEEKKDEE